MVPVHSRVFLTIGAWLLGVTAATCGSLVAVSLIGQSIGSPATQQLTSSSVSRALAADDHSPKASPAASPAQASRPAATAPPSPQPSGAAAPAGTLLSSAGGSVVAECRPAGAYLLSWSPQSGYATDNVVRGPAATAQVQFETTSQEVSMAVSCAGSVPSASVSTEANDGGGGGKGGGGGPGKGGGTDG